MKKYQNLLWGIVTAIFVGFLPPEPFILVKILSYIFGISAGVHLVLFLLHYVDNKS